MTGFPLGLPNVHEDVGEILQICVLVIQDKVWVTSVSWVLLEFVNLKILPSLKLTANAPKSGWLEYDPFLLGMPIFRGELLVSGRVILQTILCMYSKMARQIKKKTQQI